MTSGSPPGVFEQLNTEALAALDRIVGLDLTEVSLDGSLHKAPYGGEGTGPNPTDRAKLGWKWSAASETHGIPIGWATDGANRNDICLVEPTLDAADAGLLADIDTLHLDRGYDYPVVRSRLATTYGLNDLVIQPRRSKQLGKKPPVRLGLRWIVEATNAWWSNYGQLRRNTDRRTHHRHAALCLATTITLIIGRLIDHRTRWSSA